MARTANVFECVEPEVKEHFNVEMEKGMEDIRSGRVYSADEVEVEIKREFGNETEILSS